MFSALEIGKKAVAISYVDATEIMFTSFLIQRQEPSQAGIGRCILVASYFILRIITSFVSFLFVNHRKEIPA